MRRESGPEESPERHIESIRRATRKKHSTEEKIRIVLSGLRGEHSIAELCRRGGIAESLYRAWSKEFLEAGRRRLAGAAAAGCHEASGPAAATRVAARCHARAEASGATAPPRAGRLGFPSPRLSPVRTILLRAGA